MAKHPRDVKLHIIDGGENEEGFDDTPATEQSGFNERLVSETRQRAEEAVNDVKRQAVIELQKAVAAAETKANELVAAERAKMEKLLHEARKHSDENSSSNHSKQTRILRHLTPRNHLNKIRAGIVAEKHMKHVRDVTSPGIADPSANTKIGRTITKSVLKKRCVL
ncbi:mtg8 eto eight twenty one protein [Holotrichia oblita]|uniref:Mtg8 eto eight twenty one protein n=1 Tax=Holotrichia oblita TaxID=644536 RepID=A0ACB9TK00_HOLOL|nr:mtg8 eto eight twenty one protein [Holotrichia oblita]